eukprot:GAFH01003864.1.p1 GENE.GAFH01003864.1~~GAFH01003864.1.p1  ORF type:complete len:162 (+),score=48.14 GAFH01003864.1:178-663(+)
MLWGTGLLGGGLASRGGGALGEGQPVGDGHGLVGLPLVAGPQPQQGGGGLARAAPTQADHRVWIDQHLLLLGGERELEAGRVEDRHRRGDGLAKGVRDVELARQARIGQGLLGRARTRGGRAAAGLVTYWRRPLMIVVDPSTFIPAVATANSSNTSCGALE